MIHKVEMQPRGEGRRARYPWHLLAEKGDSLLLHGDGLNSAAAQQAAGTYARRLGLLLMTHGFRRPVQLLLVVRGA